MISRVALIALAPATAAAQPRAEIRVWTARAIATVLAEIGPEFERTSGYRLKITSDLPNGFARRSNAGEQFDVLISTSRVVDEWVEGGKVMRGSRIDLARSGIGVAVRAGTKKPDISTIPALTRALLDAKSIAYLRVGSGLHVDTLVERLGIAGPVTAKAVRPETDSLRTRRRW